MTDLVGAIARATAAVAEAAKRDPVVYRSRRVKGASKRLVWALMVMDDRRAAWLASEVAARAEELRALGVDPGAVALQAAASVDALGTDEARSDAARMRAWAAA